MRTNLGNQQYKKCDTFSVNAKYIRHLITNQYNQLFCRTCIVNMYSVPADVTYNMSI